MRHVFGAALVLCTAVALAFLVLPMLAIFLQVPPGTLVDQLTSQVVVDALLVTLKTSVIANVIILVIGTPAAYFLATRRFRGRSLVITLIELPLVLPPAVAGIGLLAAFGRTGSSAARSARRDQPRPSAGRGGRGRSSSWPSPFYLRQASPPSRRSTPTWSTRRGRWARAPARTFARVALPMAAGGLAAGAALACARAWGSSVRHSCSPAASRALTQTCRWRSTPAQTNFARALALRRLLVAFSGALLLASSCCPRGHAPSSLSTSRFRDGLRPRGQLPT